MKWNVNANSAPRAAVPARARRTATCMLPAGRRRRPARALVEEREQAVAHERRADRPPPPVLEGVPGHREGGVERRGITKGSLYPMHLRKGSLYPTSIPPRPCPTAHDEFNDVVNQQGQVRARVIAIYIGYSASYWSVISDHPNM